MFYRDNVLLKEESIDKIESEKQKLASLFMKNSNFEVEESDGIYVCKDKTYAPMADYNKLLANRYATAVQNALTQYMQGCPYLMIANGKFTMKNKNDVKKVLNSGMTIHSIKVTISDKDVSFRAYNDPDNHATFIID